MDDFRNDGAGDSSVTSVCYDLGPNGERTVAVAQHRTKEERLKCAVRSAAKTM